MSDILLIAVYGAVAFFFAMRFFRTRKAPSLLLALTAPLGWCFVAVWDLGLFEPHPYGLVRWVGVLLGVALLASVVRWDRVDPKEVKLRPTAAAYDRE